MYRASPYKANGYRLENYHGLDTALYNRYTLGEAGKLGTWWNPLTWFNNNATTQQKTILATILDGSDPWDVKRKKALDYVDTIATEAGKGNPEYTGLFGQYRGIVEAVAALALVGGLIFVVVKYGPKGGMKL